MKAISLGLLVVLLSAASTDAQRPRRGRVIQLDLHHEQPRLPPLLLTYVGSTDSCPGATLLRLCGRETPPETTCEASVALSTVGIDGLESCRSDAALIPVAIALSKGVERDELLGSRRLFERLSELPQYRAFAIVGFIHTTQRLADTRVPPHAAMARLMALRRLGPGMRDTAIDLFAHSLVDRDADADGVDDLASDETVISPSRLPDMPGAADVAWRTLELLMDVAAYDHVQRALDTFEARWPDVRKRDRWDIRARALRANNQHDDMLDHLRATVRRCARTACRTHFTEQLLAALVQGLGGCRVRTVERPLVRRCMRDALEAEELLTSDTPASHRNDVASTIAWAASELQSAAGNRAPAMETPSTHGEAHGWGDVDRRGVWRLIEERGLERLRRCGGRRGGAIRIQLDVGEDGRLSLAESSTSFRATVTPFRARRCVQRALSNLRGPPARGGIGRVDGTLVYAP